MVTRKQRERRRQIEEQRLGVRTSEQLLIEWLPDAPPTHMICTSLGRGQLAATAAERLSETTVDCLFLDLFLAEQARNANAERSLSNLQFRCEVDFPEEPCQLAALPFTTGGEAELTWNLMQSAFQRLEQGGQLAVAVDNPNDTWLRERMRNLFKKTTTIPHDLGVVYVGRKSEPLKKVKQFDEEFAFRDAGRLYKVITQPSVFSHRRLDLGARALMEAMNLNSGDRVLELGCGAGAVCFAAAGRNLEGTVHGMDSNPRAVACTLEGARRNDLPNITAELTADARVDQPGSYDLVLANPPYFSNFRIAELFVNSAAEALKRGGRLQIVTKHPAWFLERLPQQFRKVRSTDSRRYKIISGVR
ncbi:class I SAM-dependent methyltransferase [Thalassoroseus pseudoceratinae]|uniref:class I SAM-dependent methyltransferase n=1 Tax=Thalassoroseus pseudoceratinae TaxID=2713176 RepID=UPI0014210173|nr:methyltransferase [Thalassoroseus pseudoceratinae]